MQILFKGEVVEDHGRSALLKYRRIQQQRWDWCKWIDGGESILREHNIYKIMWISVSGEELAVIPGAITVMIAMWLLFSRQCMMQLAIIIPCKLSRIFYLNILGKISCVSLQLTSESMAWGLEDYAIECLWPLSLDDSSARCNMVLVYVNMNQYHMRLYNTIIHLENS